MLECKAQSTPIIQTIKHQVTKIWVNESSGDSKCVVAAPMLTMLVGLPCIGCFNFQLNTKAKLLDIGPFLKGNAHDSSLHRTYYSG